MRTVRRKGIVARPIPAASMTRRDAALPANPTSGSAHGPRQLPRGPGDRGRGAQSCHRTRSGRRGDNPVTDPGALEQPRVDHTDRRTDDTLRGQRRQLRLVLIPPRPSSPPSKNPQHLDTTRKHADRHRAPRQTPAVAARLTIEETQQRTEPCTDRTDLTLAHPPPTGSTTAANSSTAWSNAARKQSSRSVNRS